MPHDDLEVVVDDLGNRRQAVGGAGGVGNDVVLGRIVLVLVDAQHDGDVFAGRRSGDDDLLHRAAQVLLGQLGLGELAGGLDDHLRADDSQSSLAGSFSAKTRMLLAVDADGVGGGGDVVRQVAEDGVVLQQMRQCLGVGEVVDRDEFEVLVGERGAQNVAADAAEAVDAYFDCHFASLRIRDLKSQ